MQSSEFNRYLPELESGISVTMSIPKKAGFFGTGGAGARKAPAWLALDQASGEFTWSTLEQKNGRPLEEGRIPVCEVLVVRNTGAALELSVKGQSQPTVLEFSTADERQKWAKYMELAVEVLTPESERAALDAARDGHRRVEMDERRKTNEERKKKLQEGLGMRFTAEAMMNRADGK